MMTEDVFHPGGGSVRTGDTYVVETLRILGRHKRVFAGTALMVFVFGILTILSLTPRYQATATVVIPPPVVDPLAAGTDGGGRLDDDALATEASLLASRDVAASVISHQLAAVPAAPPTISPLARFACDRFRWRLACPRPPVAGSLDAQISGFLARLTVLPEQRSRVLDVSFTAPTAVEAAAGANGVVTEYQRIALASQGADLGRTVDWLDRRTDELRQRWLDAVRAAGDFRTAHRLTDVGSQDGGLGDAEVAQAAASLQNAEARLAAARARQSALQDAMARGDAASAISLADQPLVVQQTNALSTLLAQRAQEQAQFGPNYPDLSAINREISQSRAALRATMQTALRSVENDVVAATAEVAELSRGLTQSREQAGGEVAPVVTYRTLTEEADSARTVYETFLTRQKELADRTEIQAPPVIFVSHAPVPSAPTFPKKSRFAAAVVVLALVCGFGAALLADYLHPGFSDVGRLRDAVGLPLLAALPRAWGSQARRIAREVHQQPYSRFSEAVRGLATQIELTERRGQGGRSVLISSADAQEGKTTLAILLAETAGAGRRAVVVDGDHRRGSVSRMLGASEGPGLTDVIAGRVRLDDVIRHDAAADIAFIGCGRRLPRPLSPAEMDVFGRVVGELRMRYGLVVVDSPPLLALSDALIYARFVDQTVFVCRWRRTTRSAVITSVERLRMAGARLSGLVLSMVDPGSGLVYGGDYSRRDVRTVARLYGP